MSNNRNTVTNGSRPHDAPSVRLEDRFPVRADGETNESPRPGFIDFVRVDGHRQAYPYYQLIWIDSLEATKIDFHFSSHTVTVVGVRLNLLYEQVLIRRLSRVQAQEVKHLANASKHEAFVTKISVARVEGTRTELDSEDYPIDPEGEGS